MNFQCQWSSNVEMTVAKKCVPKMQYHGYKHYKCVFHSLCMAYCCHEYMLVLSMVPNCHIIITVKTILNGVLRAKEAVVILTFNKQYLPKKTNR